MLDIFIGIVEDDSLEISKNAMDLLADLGYDPQFGARPMKRVLQREIINQLSKELLSGRFQKGDTIYIDEIDDILTFEKEAKILDKEEVKKEDTEEVKNKNTEEVKSDD